MEYSIRNCEITDLPKLLILIQKHAEFEKAEFSPEGKEKGLKTRSNGMVVELRKATMKIQTLMSQAKVWVGTHAQTKIRSHRWL